MRFPSFSDVMAALGVGFHAVKGDPSPEDRTIKDIAAEDDAFSIELRQSVATASVSSEDGRPEVMISERFKPVNE